MVETVDTLALEASASHGNCRFESDRGYSPFGAGSFPRFLCPTLGQIVQKSLLFHTKRRGFAFAPIARCTLFDVNFQPQHMSVGKLEAGLRWLFAEIYNDRELARRRRHYMEIVKRKTAPRELAMAQ